MHRGIFGIETGPQKVSKDSPDRPMKHSLLEVVTVVGKCGMFRELQE